MKKFAFAFALVVVISINLQPKQQTVRPLRSILPRVQIITCQPGKVPYPTDVTANVCESQHWGGFGWKLKQLLKYAETQSNDSMLVLIDGKDTFANREALASSFWPTFRKFDADVIVASDEACRLEICDGGALEARALSAGPSSTSAFANSPMAGRAWAIKAVLRLMIQQDGSDKADDQLLAEWLVKTKHNNTTLRLALDTQQSFFGSFNHVARQSSGHAPHRSLVWPKRDVMPCTDGLGNLFRKCGQVAVKLQTEAGVQLTDNLLYTVARTCNVLRAHSALHYRPLFWHGNWRGRGVYNLMRSRRTKCLESL